MNTAPDEPRAVRDGDPLVAALASLVRYHLHAFETARDDNAIDDPDDPVEAAA